MIALRVLNKALQAVNDIQMVVKKTLFQTTNFHCFHMQFFRLFSSQLSDPIVSDSIINTLLIHLLIENRSLDTIHEQKSTDAEEFKKAITNIFIQTEFDKSIETDFSTNHTFLGPLGCYSNIKIFAYKAVTQYFPLKFDIVDEISAKNDTLQVNCAFSECFSPILQLFYGRIPLE